MKKILLAVVTLLVLILSINTTVFAGEIDLPPGGPDPLRIEINTCDSDTCICDMSEQVANFSHVH